LYRFPFIAMMQGEYRAGVDVAGQEQSLWEAFLALRDWARQQVEPSLTWLPDWIEPYAIDIAPILVIILTLLAAWRRSAEIWGIFSPIFRRIRMWTTGYEPPKSEAEIAGEAAKRAEEAAVKTQLDIEEIRALLTAQAEETKNSGGALSEDALERAVAAAQEILASNDPSKEIARDALRDGDLQAAEDALEEAFERETAAISRLDDEVTLLQQKSAETAREKAAMAAVRSAAEALRWYQKAAELDPNDCRTQIELSRLYRATGDLTSSRKAGYAALELADNDIARAAAIADIGGILMAQGMLPEAMESYKGCLALWQRSAAAEPDVISHRRNVSWAHDKIGSILMIDGDTDEALEHFGSSLEIQQRLSEEDSSRIDLQLGFATAHQNIGWIHRKKGDYAASLDCYQITKDILILARLAVEAPADQTVQKALSSAHIAIGELGLILDDADEALQNFRQSLDIIRPLAIADESNLFLQTSLSGCHRNLGIASERQGDTAAAMQHYQEDLAIEKHCSAIDPDNNHIQVPLALTHDRIGDLCRTQDELFHSELSDSHVRIGDLHWHRNDEEKALESYQSVLEITKQRAADQPDDTDAKHQLACIHEAVADTLNAMSRAVEAIEHYRSAIKIREFVALGEPDNADIEYEIADSHAGIGDAYDTLGQKRMAIGAYEQSLQIVRSLANRFPDNSTYRDKQDRIKAHLIEIRPKVKSQEEVAPPPD
jgi:tetratricopeptide (TPR) repeat protein